jgi:RNA polymerase sigma-70 factor (ECF subfamily)
MLRGPEEPPFGEAERLAVQKALGLIASGEIDPKDLPRLMLSLRDHIPEPPPEAEQRVWEVLTVDVVDGRIQTVRIVRNPDKLAHL